MSDEDWRAGVNLKLADIDKRINLIETRNAVDAVHRDNVEGRLGDIESTLNWLVRLIIGAIVLALIGILFQGGIK